MQEKAFAGAEVSDRVQCASWIESAVLVALCSDDADVCTKGGMCLQELCTEMAIVDDSEDAHHANLPPAYAAGNISEYRHFLNSNEKATGKVAQQKRIRKMLRNLPASSDGVVNAWEEIYRRWASVSQSILKPAEEAHHLGVSIRYWYDYNMCSRVKFRKVISGSPTSSTRVDSLERAPPALRQPLQIC